MILVCQRGPLVYTHEYNGTHVSVYTYEGPPCFCNAQESNINRIQTQVSSMTRRMRLLLKGINLVQSPEAIATG